MKCILFFITIVLVCLQQLPAAAETIAIIADQDACIDKVCPDCFLGGDWRALVSGSSGTQSYGLFHFDLSSLPAEARIDSASLVLCVHGKAMVTTYWAYPLLKPWAESSVTWDQASAATAWQTPGGDYDPGLVASCALPTTAPGWAVMDVTALVRDDQGRVKRDVAQHGLLLKSNKNYSKILTHEFSSNAQARTCHSCHGALEPERDAGKSTDCARCHSQGDLRLPGEPTLVIAYSDNATAGTLYRCAAMHDTTIEQSAPGLNQGSAGGIAVSGASANDGMRRGLLRFSIPSFISAGQVKRAMVHLYSKSDAASAIKIYPMTAGWFEKDVADSTGDGYLSYGATWNDRGGEDNNTGWAVPGGDCDATSGATMSVAPGWNELDLTGFVSAHLDRLRRFGMQLRSADEAGEDEHELAAREDTEHAPCLELTADLGLADGEYLCPTLSDVYIDAGGRMYPERADQNFNHKTRVLVSWHNSYGASRGLWKFELPADLDASRIDNATLCLSGAEHAMNYNKLAINCYALNAPFREEEDTWGSLAGGDYDAGLASPGTLCQEILPGPFVNWRARVDVTDLLAGNLDKVRSNGLLIKSTGEGTTKLHQNMASREAYDVSDMAAYLKIKATPLGSSTTTTTELVSTTTTIAASSTTTIHNETSSSTTSFVDNATSTTTTTTIAGTSTTTSTIKDFGRPPRTSSTTTSSVVATSTTSTAAVTTTIPEPPPETTTTSTAAPQEPCPLEQVLGGRQGKLDLLRRLRDERMATSKTGITLVVLYYACSGEISRILDHQPEYRAAAAACLQELLPAVRAGLQSGLPVALSPDAYARTVLLLRRLQAAGSAGLQQAIDYFLQTMESGALADIVVVQRHEH